MAKNVVIVESPSKVSSVNKYLGSEFTVLASYGHIRDLPSKSGSVDPDKEFSMIWEFGDRGDKSLTAIERALKTADALYLATDPDREGEAISWHVVDALKERKALKAKKIYRIVFNEITKTAVQNAVKKPREIDQSLVDAYLARRALDYLVGFTLSPVLWRKLPGAKSAGRVQSVALRLIVEREEEIERFNPQEYWTIEGFFENSEGKNYKAKLTHFNKKKLDKFSIQKENEAKKIVEAIEAQFYSIDSIEKKQVKRNPTPPFITSTLQQEAARKLGFSGKKTMQLAQSLYEGVKLDGENVGLITYMRTDSINLSNDALNNIRDFIPKNYGKQYLPDAPRVYKSKAKNAQEAHEAIRPTDVNRMPKDLTTILEKDQLRLYELIWKRSVACQMESAIFDQVGVDILSDDKTITFRATGSTLVFDGFLSVYQEGQDDAPDDSEDESRLPKLNESEKAPLLNVDPNQHFTQPPPRFSEASLVKKLEELGIGRPSTYVSIIQVLQDRSYVVLEKKQFRPEDRGRIVTSFLKNHFTQYVQYDFTANLEEQLDDISAGSLEWRKVMDAFWESFSRTIQSAMLIPPAIVVEEIEHDMAAYLFKDGDRTCPACKKSELNLKIFRHGAVLACSGYPLCSYVRPLVEGDELENPERFLAFEPKHMGIDPRSNKNVYLKKGPYGFYFEWELLKGEKKPKRASLLPSQNYETVTLEDALKATELPIILGKHPDFEEIKVNSGRFGPYVQSKEGYASIPKALDPLTLTYEQAIEIIMAKKAKGPSTRGRKKSAEPAKKKKG
ncbi:MAG: DNA topoisomerase 1 [Holosporales bacterium]